MSGVLDPEELGYPEPANQPPPRRPLSADDIRANRRIIQHVFGCPGILVDDTVAAVLKRIPRRRG